MLATVFFYVTGLPNNGNVSRLDYWSLVPFQLMDLVDPEFESRLPHGFFYLFERIGYSLVSAALIIGSAVGGGCSSRIESIIQNGSLRKKQELIDQATPAIHGTNASTGNLLFSPRSGARHDIDMRVDFRADGAVINHSAGSLAGRRKCRGLRGFSSASTSVEPTGMVIDRQCLAIPRSLDSSGLGLGTAISMDDLVGGVSPTTDFDVKEYHLGGPKEYFLKGQIEFLPHNVYTSFPFLTEMLSLAAMVLMNDWLAGVMSPL